MLVTTKEVFKIQIQQGKALVLIDFINNFRMN